MGGPQSGDRSAGPVPDPSGGPMRRLFRSIAPVIAATALVIAGSASVFAAAPTTTPVDASWCIVSGTRETCYDIDGTIQYHDSAAGSSISLHKTIRTTVYDAGQFVGASKSVTMSRSVFQADGTFVIQTVTNTRSSADGEPCEYRLLMRLVDFEAVVYQSTSTCGA